MELLVQDYLRNVGDLESLKGGFGITHERNAEDSNLVKLNYKDEEAFWKADSDYSKDIAAECTNLVLDEANNWSIVSEIL